MEDFDDISRNELYERATALNIEGRSGMDKQQLYDAVAAAEAPPAEPESEPEVPEASLHDLRATLNAALNHRDRLGRRAASVRAMAANGGATKGTAQLAETEFAQAESAYRQALTDFEVAQAAAQRADS